MVTLRRRLLVCVQDKCCTGDNMVLRSRGRVGGPESETRKVAEFKEQLLVSTNFERSAFLKKIREQDSTVARL